MTQIDWSKAPEGATHFLPEQLSRGWVACWYRNIDGTWFARNNHDCDWYPDHDCQDVFIPLLIERQPAWTGEGLPPVGTVCEFMKHNSPPAPEGKWLVGEILYLSHFTVIISGDMCEHVHHPRNCSFRPIRTPDQLAAEEREKAVRNMKDIWRANYEGLVEDGLYALYDAEYRKVEVTS